MFTYFSAINFPQYKSSLQAIHKGQTCEDYQDSLTGHFKVTERYINDLKNLGDVMNCPKCDVSYF